MTRAEAPTAVAALGLKTPDPEHLWRIRTLELGPVADQRIGRYPPIEGDEYVALASAVDGDGDEVAGIRLPELTVPVGTHLAWNLRHHSIGAPEQILSMLGSIVFFAATRAERERASDPRPSLAERYGSRDAYLEQVRQPPNSWSPNATCSPRTPRSPWRRVCGGTRRPSLEAKPL